MNWPNDVGGITPFAAWLRKILRCAKGTQILPGRGYKIASQIEGIGTILDINPGTGGGSSTTIGQYILNSVEDDYLVCSAYTAKRDTNSFGQQLDTFTLTRGATVYIAKQYHLRCSIKTTSALGIKWNFDYQYGADTLNKYRIKSRESDASTEIQQVIPPWSKSDLIYAMPANDLTILDPQGNQIKLLMCAQSRQWAQA